MTAAGWRRGINLSAARPAFGRCYDFSVLAYVSLIYRNQTPPGVFTRRFWSAASQPIKRSVGERRRDGAHNGNCERGDANEVIISVSETRR